VLAASMSSLDSATVAVVFASVKLKVMFVISTQMLFL
jgi:hypothetical protein